VAIRESHEVRRRASFAPNLDDEGDLVRIADGVAVHVESIADGCLHALTIAHFSAAAQQIGEDGQ
jgi:hypothetical protein